jgi:UDP-N-acetylmuramate dehydrogenase
MLDARLERALRECFGRRLAPDEPLARHTSLRVGGPADALVRVDTRGELESLAALCAAHATPLFVLGAGFNTLVRDGGIRGVVVRLAGLRSIERRGAELWAQAGVTHTQLTRFAAQEGLAGLEFGVGVPGTLGGWLAMNAGTREREVKDAVTAVEWLASGVHSESPASALRFAYRKLERPAGSILLGARLALWPDDPRAIRARMREQLEQRRATQPVDQPSCGSVFKNPPGDFAGRLIDAAGLKGLRCGGAQISELHANFIVTSNALASDVIELIARARMAVSERFGVQLETEVQIVGDPA